MLSTGSEHQGQNSISDPDQNLGFSCIFSSGMQETDQMTQGEGEQSNRSLYCLFGLFVHIEKQKYT